MKDSTVKTLQPLQGGILGGLLMVGLLLAGCSSSVPAASPSQAKPAPTAQSEANLGQNLPIAAEVQIGQQSIQLEVAKTLDQQALGLMYRPSLDANRGMLFPFTPARPVSFWMKNVVIDLDMVFVREGKIIAIASNVPPCQSEPCPVYGPGELVDQVIELRGGRAGELGLKAGDRLTVKYR